MRRIRRTEVTVETDEILIISAQRSFGEFCRECREGLTLVTSEQAALLTSVGEDRIRAWAESGLIHHTRTVNGVLLVCLKSVVARLDSPHCPQANPGCQSVVRLKQKR